MKVEFKLSFDITPSQDIKDIEIKILDITQQYNCSITNLTKEYTEEVDKEYINDIYILENPEADYKSIPFKRYGEISPKLFERFPEKFDWYKVALLGEEKLGKDFLKRNIEYIPTHFLVTMDLDKEYIIENKEKFKSYFEELYLTQNFDNELKEVFKEEIKEIKEKNNIRRRKSKKSVDSYNLLGEKIKKEKEELANLGINPQVSVK
jgi:hypothetical protein